MRVVKINKDSLQDYINTKSKKELDEYTSDYETKYNGCEIKVF